MFFTEENDKFIVDSDLEKKRTRRASRTKKSLASSQYSPSASPVLLLGGGSEEKPAVELAHGLDMEDYDGLETHICVFTYASIHLEV